MPEAEAAADVVQRAYAALDGARIVSWEASFDTTAAVEVHRS